MTTPTTGGRTRDLLLAAARTARACGLYTTAAALAGWLLEHAEGSASDALSLDAPVGQVQLASARSLLADVLIEEGRPVPATIPYEEWRAARRRMAEDLERSMGLALPGTADEAAQ